ncbi:uncharacterized protein LOC119263672 [Pygocentrus nattereri]|uniref:uncharacterized protein LOC119263672 n=1 Tax=Pygocentrus nattereri TaxID=42514 RepID=UPI0018911A85|nr:uncharacterized protein LOC119263672 [Pygocentrus nattereri]
MKLPAFIFGAQLRPAVLWAAGISAAAVTSALLFYRWRIQDGQRTTRDEDAATQTDGCDGTEEHRLAILPSGCAPVPQEVSVLSWQQAVLIPPLSCGALVRFEQHCQALDRANRMFAYTFSQPRFDSTKLVELKLQHRTICEGLESEHWWVLSNEFYHLFAELPPQHFATVAAVACIKRFGTSISEATFYLRTESVETSLQNVTLQTKVGKTLKMVSIGSDGCFRTHHSSNTRILETPAPYMVSSKPRGPPPGF